MRRNCMEVSASVTPATRRIARVGRQQQVQLAFEGNRERVLDERILPGVDVGLLGHEHDVVLLGERRGAGDVHGARGAGLHAFFGQSVGGSKSPAALRHHANAEAERFRFGEGADLPVLCGEVALADIHHARVGKRRAAHARGFERQIGPFLHESSRQRARLYVPSDQEAR